MSQHRILLCATVSQNRRTDYANITDIGTRIRAQRGKCRCLGAPTGAVLERDGPDAWGKRRFPHRITNYGITVTVH
jgi:hypothetical protein